MSKIVNRETNEYRKSVNTIDYTDPPWLINPDTTAVINETDNIPTQFWIVPQEGDPSIIVTADRIAWKKSVTIDNLVNERNNQEDLGFNFDGNNYQPDEDENKDLYSSVAANVRYGTPIPDNYFWRTSDGTDTPLPDSTILLKIFTAFNSRKDLIRQVFYNKTDEINALTTEEEIDAYDVTTGWPPL